LKKQCPFWASKGDCAARRTSHGTNLVSRSGKDPAQS
jgi:hypothetical protein